MNPLIQAKAMPTDLFKISPSQPWAICEAAVDKALRFLEARLFNTEELEGTSLR